MPILDSEPTHPRGDPSARSNGVWAALDAELRRRGLLRARAPALGRARDLPRFQPIEIAGEPMSKTTLRNRR